MPAATPFKYAVYFVVSMVGVFLVYSVWNMVFTVYLVPTLTTQITSATANIDATTQSTILTAYSNILTGIRLVPFILFGFGSILWLVHIVRKEREEVYV